MAAIRTESEIRDKRLSLMIERSKSPYSERGMELNLKIEALAWVLKEIEDWEKTHGSTIV